jgi:hypothetical protein
MTITWPVALPIGILSYLGLILPASAFWCRPYFDHPVDEAVCQKAIDDENRAHPGSFGISSCVSPVGSGQAAIDKFQVCCLSVPNLAEAAYCSVWRTKCGLSKKVETRGEIINRLYGQQYRARFPLGPMLSEDDIAYLVDDALQSDAVDLAAFLKSASDNCKRTYDINQEKRIEENVTH